MGKQVSKVHLFRPRRSTFRLGLSLLVFTTSLPVVCGIGTFVENVDRMTFWPRLLQSLSCVAMWSPFILLSIWLILSYSRSGYSSALRAWVFEASVAQEESAFRRLFGPNGIMPVIYDCELPEAA